MPRTVLTFPAAQARDRSFELDRSWRDEVDRRLARRRLKRQLAEGALVGVALLGMIAALFLVFR